MVFFTQATNALSVGLPDKMLPVACSFRTDPYNNPNSPLASRIAVWHAALFMGLACLNLAHAESTDTTKGLGLRTDFGITFDSNVTRAEEPGDKLSDRFISVNAAKMLTYPVTRHTRARLSGSLGIDSFSNYTGLGRVVGTLRGEYQYRSSADFASPILTLFVNSSVEQYRSSLRDGTRYALGASVRQPLTDRIEFFGALAHEARNAWSAVWDTKENSLRFNLDYTVTPAGTLYLGGEYRKGDVVSTGHPSLAFIDIAKAFVKDDVYPGGQLFSYRFDGKTLLTTLGYNIGFGPRTALDISWRRIASSADLDASSKYIANQYSIVYLVDF